MIAYILLTAFLLLAPFFYNYFLLDGSIPGPFLARFSDLWRLLVIRRGHAQDIYLDLHKKHGEIVRIGPNCVSLTGYDSIQAVYAISKKLEKVRFQYQLILRVTYKSSSRTFILCHKAFSMGNHT